MSGSSYRAALKTRYPPVSSIPPRQGQACLHFLPPECKVLLFCITFFNILFLNYHKIQQSYYWAYILRKPYFKKTCSPVLIAALFIIARTWKQPRYSSTDEWIKKLWSDQIRSVAQSCPTLCDPVNCSTPGLPVQHQLPEFTETHVH